MIDSYRQLSSMERHETNKAENFKLIKNEKPMMRTRIQTVPAAYLPILPKISELIEYKFLPYKV